MTPDQIKQAAEERYPYPPVLNYTELMTIKELRNAYIAGASSIDTQKIAGEAWNAGKRYNNALHFMPSTMPPNKEQRLESLKLFNKPHL